MKSDRAAASAVTRARLDSGWSFRVGRSLCVAGFPAVLTFVAGPAFAQVAPGCSGNVCNVTISADPGTSYTPGNPGYTTGAAGTLSYAVDYANKNPGVTINITTDVTLSGPLSPLLNSMTINGNSHTIDGNNSQRIFMVGVDNDNAGQLATAQQNVTISGLTLKNGLAQGGNGGDGGGGGGMGAGGALFVNQTGNVTLSNVNFDSNQARGGAGGAAPSFSVLGRGGGGGGGLGGNAGSVEPINNFAGGGGGIFGKGADGALGGSGGGGGLIGDASGRTAGGPNGSGNFASGGNASNGVPNTFGRDAGFGGGGGGGTGGTAGNGGIGGFGGGGGGATSDTGGSGGFGGGSGGAYTAGQREGGGPGGTGGNAGFGGGGGGGATAGVGGFGGGAGGAGYLGIGAGGGGGAGMGGSVFVVTGGRLSIAGDTGVAHGETNSVVAGGLNGVGVASGGSYASGFFIEGGTTLRFTSGNFTVNGVIADLDGSAGNSNTKNGVGGLGGVGQVLSTGGAYATLMANNAYTGGTTIDTASRVDVGANGSLGSGGLHMLNGSTLGFATNNLTISNHADLAGDATITVQNGFTETLASLTTDGASSGRLVKTGAGKLTVTGINTFSGGSKIDEGVLRRRILFPSDL